MSFRGRWVLVTGASSGLGRELALQLAREHGAHVLAVARRAERLELLGREITAAGVLFRPLGADLSRLEDVERVLAASKEVPLYAAVLIAGVTFFGEHRDLDWEQFRRLLDLNVVANVRLTSELVPVIEAQGGGILLIASMAGLSPVPYQAAYSASKAFLLSFGASLWHELRGRPISITTYAPGGIATEMTDGAAFGGLRGWLMPADRVARHALATFRQRSYRAIPGRRNQLGGLLMKWLPARCVSTVLAANYKRSLQASIDVKQP